MKIVQKQKTEFVNGIPLYLPNEVSVNENDKRFFISYNPSVRDYGCPTTALVIGNHEKFYILCGDHRKQYAEASTLENCLKYYTDNPNKHSFSDPL